MCMVESAGTVGGTNTVAGLLLDEWVEVVPETVERPDDTGAMIRDAMVTAGVAANVESPSARAPRVSCSLCRRTDRGGPATRSRACCATRWTWRNCAA